VTLAKTASNNNTGWTSEAPKKMGDLRGKNQTLRSEFFLHAIERDRDSPGPRSSERMQGYCGGNR
jgi:hypothetical protein